MEGLSLADKQFLYEETEAEIREQRGKVAELVLIGQDLVKGGSHRRLLIKSGVEILIGTSIISDIESEDDFPPSYLANVTEKINSAKSKELNIQALLANLGDRIDYQVEPRRLIQRQYCNNILDCDNEFHIYRLRKPGSMNC